MEKFLELGKVRFPIHDDGEKMELRELDLKYDAKEGYHFLDGSKLFRIERDNKNKLSLDEYVEKFNKDVPGFINNQDKMFGIHTLLQTFFYDNDGKKEMIRHLFFEDGDKIVGVRMVDNLKEVQLGNSNFCVYIPAIYGEPQKQDGVLGEKLIIESYDSPNTKIMPSIRVTSFNMDNISYDEFRKYILAKNISNEITKEEYEALAKGGWTLEKYNKLMDLCHKGTIIKRKKGKFEGKEWELYDVVDAQKGAEDEHVDIIAKDGDIFVRISIFQPKDNWQGIGEAIANILHNKM